MAGQQDVCLNADAQLINVFLGGIALNPFYKNLALWLIIALVMVMLYNLSHQQPLKPKPQITYSQFLKMIENKEIENVLIQDKYLYVTHVKGSRFKIFMPQDPDIINMLKKHKISMDVQPPSENQQYVSILLSWLPMLVLIGVWVFFMRQMQMGGGKALSFGKSRARLLSSHQDKVTFADVAGIEEAKEELEEIVDFLKDPKKYTRLGGRIPKGVLLTGPPGTGKTLLSKAIAGEAGVPFFSISGSDFVEMFVGVGASRVRDLFIQGKRNAPCIIFIDEIDAVGRHRGGSLGGGHDEREQTLNQLLVEMDGFESNEGVILISATNRPDVLDPALLRPGRFDRQVAVSLPDIRGREKILKVHMKRTPLSKNVNTNVLAKGTPGFSGADLENLVNEAALLSAKRNKDRLDMNDFEDAKDKVYMGLERKSKVISDEDKKTTAYHEGGHALVARFLPETEAVNKITIIPRGRAAGVTWFLPEERDFKYKDQLESELSVAFGGRIAEDLVFKRISTGASNDIKKATELASKMVRSWGMSDKLGPLSYDSQEDAYMYGHDFSQGNDYSEKTAQEIDSEIRDIIRKSYDKGVEILKENMDILHKLSELLLKKETVLGDELDALIFEMRPGIELPSPKSPERFHDKIDSEIELSDEKEKPKKDIAQSNDNKDASDEKEKQDSDIEKFDNDKKKSS